MQLHLEPDLVIAKIAGAVGAGLSLRHVKGNVSEKALYFIGGLAAAYYGTPYIVNMLHLPEGLAAFLLGNFGMSIMARAREFVDTTPMAEIVKKLLGK